MSVLRANNVWVKRGQTVLLQEVSLTFNRSEFIGIIGCNGAGKTTLLRTLAGIEPPTKGHIAFNGEEANSISNLSPRRRRVCWIPVASPQAFGFTCHDFVTLGSMSWFEEKPTSEHRHRARTSLSRLGMEPFLNVPITRLSSGERQKVALARAAATTSEIIILDEPLSHLDLASQALVMEMLQSLCLEGKLIIASFHDLTLCLAMATRIVGLSMKTVALDAKASVATREDLSLVMQTPLEETTSSTGLRFVSIPYFRKENP